MRDALRVRAGKALSGLRGDSQGIGRGHWLDQQLGEGAARDPLGDHGDVLLALEPDVDHIEDVDESPIRHPCGEARGLAEVLGSLVTGRKEPNPHLSPEHGVGALPRGRAS